MNLFSLFPETTIQLMDLGASGSLDEKWEPLSQRIALTAFDPNEEECRRLSAEKPPTKEASYLPFAISGTCENAELIQTESIYCWSLLRPNKPWLDRFAYGHLFNVEGSETIPVRNLDSLEELEGIAFDAIKMDVQGMELPILKGGEKTLESVFYLETETGFVDNYENETKFHEVSSYLLDRGFLMFDINPHHRQRRCGPFAELRESRGQPLWCEAVWLRDLIALHRDGNLPPMDREKAVRCLLLCAMEGFYDYGLELAGFFTRELKLLSGEELASLEKPEAWKLGPELIDPSDPSGKLRHRIAHLEKAVQKAREERANVAAKRAEQRKQVKTLRAQLKAEKQRSKGVAGTLAQNMKAKLRGPQGNDSRRKVAGREQPSTLAPSRKEAEAVERTLREIRPGSVMLGNEPNEEARAWIEERCRHANVALPARAGNTDKEPKENGKALIILVGDTADAESDSLVREWVPRMKEGDHLLVLELVAPESGKGKSRKRIRRGLLTGQLQQEFRLQLQPVQSARGKQGSGPAKPDRRLILRRTSFEMPADEELLAPEAAPGLNAHREQIEEGKTDEALESLNAIKAEREPRQGVDYLRAVCFLRQRNHTAACEAAKEELRLFPDHEQARALRDKLLDVLFGPPTLGGKEFQEWYRVIRPYTMLGEERLHSLYSLALKACENDLPGDFIECGVAGGGSSALIAAVIDRHSKRPRRLYSCDTFTGMPTPTEKDVHRDTGAEDTGWGSGTCASPTSSLEEICGKLGVEDLVTPVQGLFADTLPGLSDDLKEGAAFLHMDGDWYESTRDIFVHLYDDVAEGAPVQIDDYGYWSGCREAVHEFEKERSTSFQLNEIDGWGVWFEKPTASQ